MNYKQKSELIMKTIFTLMLFVSSASAQLFDDIPEKSEAEMKAATEKFFSQDTRKTKLSPEEIEKRRIMGERISSVKKQVGENINNNFKYHEQKAGLKGFKYYRKSKQEIKAYNDKYDAFSRSYFGYRDHQMAAISYLMTIHRNDKDGGFSKVKVFLKNNPYDFDTWSKRCIKMFCQGKNLIGTKEHKTDIINAVGKPVTYWLFL